MLTPAPGGTAHLLLPAFAPDTASRGLAPSDPYPCGNDAMHAKNVSITFLDLYDCESLWSSPNGEKLPE